MIKKLKLICTIEPLIALPGSPGDVVTVREVSGLTKPSSLRLSANPGLRDFWIVSEIIKGNDFPEISFDVNPSSRQVLENLMEMGAWPFNSCRWTPSSIWLYGMHRHGTSSCHEHHQP
jgi:homoaconitase/3-isopropylmalate dehydratase large subunit